jgi:hypothetical protein
MEARELRIGNIVNVGTIENMLESGVHVGKGKCYSYSEIEPVLITDEMLLKIGSKETHSKYYEIDNFDIQISLNEGICYVHHYDEDAIKWPCKYLHQLQNIYFAKNNKELEVKI